MAKSKEWKEIPNTNGIYEASIYGDIRRKDNKITLKCRTRKDGYVLVSLRCGGVRKTRYVHRLIALTFIPNEHNLPCINHIDENKQNNMVSNLEWCSIKENNNHATRVERISNKLCKKVCQCDMKGNVLKVWNSIKEATEELKIRNISQVCLGVRNKAGGYKWRYCNEREYFERG
jgi:hypothetical protein